VKEMTSFTHRLSEMVEELRLSINKFKMS